MTADGPGDRGSMQWVVAAACLLAMTCALAWVAARRPIYVGVEPLGHAQRTPPDMRLDLNAATAAQLQALPRIGPALAARIVADREANGPFVSLEDVNRVNGIGDRTIELIAPHVVVRPRTDH